ncbi:MAG: cell division protein SepF [Clostridia bacterium]|nr:cell division protein SepF [Clostridia bacterium]
MADKFIDKVKYFMGIETVADDDTYEEDQVVDVPEATKTQNTGTYYAGGSSYTKQTASASNNVVNIHKNNQMKVVLYQPKEFDDTKTIVDSLKSRKPVIINIEDIDTELARKIFDFCSGALYALDGHIQKISRGIFILAPNNVDVSGDVKTELGKKGVSPWMGKDMKEL